MSSPPWTNVIGSATCATNACCSGYHYPSSKAESSWLNKYNSRVSTILPIDFNILVASFLSCRINHSQILVVTRLYCSSSPPLNKHTFIFISNKTNKCFISDTFFKILLSILKFRPLNSLVSHYGSS